MSSRAAPRDHRNRFRRANRDDLDLDRSAPFLPWEQMYAYLRREFKQGDHVAVIGPTGSGKTHIAFPVAEIRKQVLAVACKPADPLIDEAKGRGYYVIPGPKLEIPLENGRPVYKHVVYWPKLSDGQVRKLPKHRLLAAEKSLQRPAVGSAIGYVRAKGHWCLLLDEGTWVCRDLGLQRDVDSALFHFRSLNASIVILGQRPSWMGRYVLSSPTHLFLFNTNDKDDRKALGDVSGMDTAQVRDIVGELDYDRHEVLYLDTRRRVMFRTIAPARGR